MRLSPSILRPLAFALLAVSVAGGLSGCKWFSKKGAKGDYALSPEMRPLEVPPDLNLPSTAGAMNLPNTAAQTRPLNTAAAATTTGFNVSGSRDEAFTKLGEALAGVEGVTVASRAQLLGTYDVSYEGSNFLLRVAAVQDGANISAVDPRGLPASGEAASKLIAALKAKLGN